MLLGMLLGIDDVVAETVVHTHFGCNFYSMVDQLTLVDIPDFQPKGMSRRQQ